MEPNQFPKHSDQRPENTPEDFQIDNIGPAEQSIQEEVDGAGYTAEQRRELVRRALEAANIKPPEEQPKTNSIWPWKRHR